MAASAEAVHRALDGTRFVYSGPVDLSRPATSIARVMVAGVLREFSTQPLWEVDFTAAHYGVRLDEEFSFQGGTLRVGRVQQRHHQAEVTDALTLAVWSGSKHALTTHLYDAKTSADALRLMNAATIAEHADGVVIAPKQESKAQFYEPVRSSKEIPGLGLVEAKNREAHTVTALPPWRGAQVQAGELFRGALSNGSPYLVLATSSAVITIVPEPDARLDQVVNLAAGFSVETLV